MPSFTELFLVKYQSTTILPTSALEWDLWASHYCLDLQKMVAAYENINHQVCALVVELAL